MTRELTSWEKLRSQIRMWWHGILYKIGKYFLKITEEHPSLIPCIIFKCGRCGSECVQVVTMPGWEQPSYNCLECNYLLAESNVSFRLVTQETADKELSDEYHNPDFSTLVHRLA